MTNPTIITTANGMNHLVDGPLTTTAVREASPDLLVNEIDNRVVRIRPMATPIDQISRMIGARSADSMIVDYYSVDTRPIEGVVRETAAPQGPAEGQLKPFVLYTDDDRMFAPTETILAPEVLIHGAGDAEGEASEALVLYVIAKTTDNGLKVVPLNGNGLDYSRLEEGARLVRMGRAAAELDVQTSQFEALPIKSQNFCQIFKSQIEQSTFAKLSAKEVGWTFTDQEEVAIMDMRLGMEKSFLFGAKTRITDPDKFDEVLFTGGIWNQAGATVKLPINTLTEKDLIGMMRQAFTGDCAGSTRKILVAGSELINAINCLEAQRVFTASDTVTRWGIDFNEIRSKFGTLYVIHSEVFDQCGHTNDGMIIDPQYLTKYVHVPFTVDHLDLKKSGVRNTDALVVTEASCLVLRHPKTHLRVQGQWND